ncbi:MAG: flagellar hook-length control protein FliK [Aminivibrio sp.]|jgi:flagellar hook-length control protein FliK
MISPFTAARGGSSGRELFADKIQSSTKTEKKDLFASFLYSSRKDSQPAGKIPEADLEPAINTPGRFALLPQTFSDCVIGEESANEDESDILIQEPLRNGGPDYEEQKLPEDKILVIPDDETDPTLIPQEVFSAAGTEHAISMQTASVKVEDSAELVEENAAAMETPLARAGTEQMHSSREKTETPEHARTEAGDKGKEDTRPAPVHVSGSMGSKENKSSPLFKDMPEGKKEDLTAVENPRQMEEAGKKHPEEDDRAADIKATPPGSLPEKTAASGNTAESSESYRDLPSASGSEVRGRHSTADSGGERGAPGEKGEGKGSSSRGHENAVLPFADRAQSVGAGGTRQAASSPQPSFARELELAGKGGAALEDGVGNVVKFMRSEGRHRASIIVDPPALGRVEVELASGTAGVEASIRVANEQLKQLVQDHISQLRTHLQQQGVQLAEFTVDISDHGKEGRGEAGYDGRDGRSRAASLLSGEDEETPIFRVDLELGLLHWMA